MSLILYSPGGILFSITFLVVASSLHYVLRSKKHVVQPNPTLGKSGDRDFHAALLEGYAKYKNTPFEIPTAHHSTTIVPGRFIDELKGLPEDILSFQKQVTARFLGKYTGLGVNDVLVQSVKVDLTKNIPGILGELEAEVHYSVRKHISECDDWTDYQLYEMLLHLVSLLSGRIFVGLPLSRDQTWLNATINYTIDGFVGAQKLWQYPRILHPVMQYLIPEVRKVKNYLSDGAKMLAPHIQENQPTSSSDRKSNRSNMVQWIIDNSTHKDKANIPYVTRTQMLISVVAIHTTTMTLTQVIFDLLAHPHYISILREEIQQVRPNGTDHWTKAHIAALRKMDSFLKESQRFRPPGLITMNRQVEKPITLSNGNRLEKGSHIGIAAGSNAMDPRFFESPQEFDGLRFFKLRALPGNETKYQFVSTGHDQLHWGIGIHACPGRFFASYEIKMLLAKILTDYDLKLTSEARDRPQDIAVDTRVIPNPEAKVSFKKR